MAAEFSKPTHYWGDKFDSFEGGVDPASILRTARDTAHALLERGRASDDPELIERLVRYTDEHGIDAIAELWARSSARSLPGALWRIYLLRLVIQQDREGTAFLFQRGADQLASIDTVIAGAPSPTGPDEIIELADRILRGAFTGDFAIALDRGASFARILAAGCTSLADDADPVDAAMATELTLRASRYALTADELSTCARLHRVGNLD